MVFCCYGAGSESEPEAGVAELASSQADAPEGESKKSASHPESTAAPATSEATAESTDDVSVVVCDQSESEEDVWFKRRTNPNTRQSKPRKNKPNAPPDMGKALVGVAAAVVDAFVAAQASAGCQPPKVPASRLMAALPAVAAAAANDSGVSVPPAQGGSGASAPGGPAPGSGVLDVAGIQASSTAEQERSPRKAPKEDVAAAKKKRAPRGTAGTFAGRRPPKDPHKLQIFLAKKDAHEKAKMDAKSANKKAPSLRQRQCWEELSETMKNGGGPVVARKRPAAALPLAATPSPKKRTESSQPTPEKPEVEPAAGKSADHDEPLKDFYKSNL